MDHEIRDRPSAALLDVDLEAGESVVAEAGAMVGMSAGVSVETSADGGLLGSLKRSVLGGESFFLNTFTASEAGEVTLAPPLPGDVVHHRIDGGTLLVQSGSYLAASEGVDVDTKFGGGGAPSSAARGCSSSS